ncbi:amidohydrolase family protein [[Eubacterium] cellulosolvens]
MASKPGSKKSRTRQNYSDSSKSSPRRDNDSANKGSNSDSFKKVNALLVVLILVFSAVLVYRFFIISSDSNDDGPGTGENHVVGNLTVRSIIPPREAGIINGHEHIQNFEQGEKWLAAMDQVGVSTTVMLGSPDATFYLKPSGHFNKYKENNEELFKLVDKYPENFIAYPTIYTYDENKLDLLKNYIKRGALGLKLFNGHFAVFYEHLGPLNESSMFSVYEYCEKEHIPIIYHIHLGQEKLQKEFEEILEAFPNLIMNVPHFMLSSINLWQTNGQGRLRYYLETYPNLYTDVSFGYWVKDGLWRISNHTEVFRDFMIEFQDRFTFGTDMVCTREKRKTVEWVANLTQGYIDILEKTHFNLTVTPDVEGDFNGDAPGTHNGMNLPKSVLDKIYYDNMVKFLNFRFYYEKLSDVINESKFTYKKSNSRTTSSTHGSSFSATLCPVINYLFAIDQKYVVYNYAIESY